MEESLGESLEHGGASGNEDTLEEVESMVRVALADGLEHHPVNRAVLGLGLGLVRTLIHLHGRGLVGKQGGIEEDLREAVAVHPKANVVARGEFKEPGGKAAKISERG